MSRYSAAVETGAIIEDLKTCADEFVDHDVKHIHDLLDSAIMELQLAYDHMKELEVQDV